MCQSCATRPRVHTPLTAGGTRLRVPPWLNQQARQYLESQRYPNGAASLQFGQQVVWTRSGPRRGRYHTTSGQQELHESYAFEYFPGNREYYVPYFTFRRSSSNWCGRIRDALTQEDELWEALYQTYQLYNRDMRRLVFQQHQSPRDARAFLSRLDARLHNQIIGAMIDLTTSYIAAPGAPVGCSAAAVEHVAGVVRQIAQVVSGWLRRDTSLAHAIMAEARAAEAQHAR